MSAKECSGDAFLGSWGKNYDVMSKAKQTN
jgi:hypothetical protein